MTTFGQDSSSKRGGGGVDVRESNIYLQIRGSGAADASPGGLIYARGGIRGLHVTPTSHTHIYTLPGDGETINHSWQLRHLTPAHPLWLSASLNTGVILK